MIGGPVIAVIATVIALTCGNVGVRDWHDWFVIAINCEKAVIALTCGYVLTRDCRVIVFGEEPCGRFPGSLVPSALAADFHQ